ncbi:hypothetical protein M9H77_12775 [Catharanthus roseus]|uniref:Uncharacterized protein n=1 Tax=Catharanthus roseus TaxID=4058 RepID=A0ACC0BID8_CATRO|nr:hypothetical protein M9H77_12775 [Catharanthus roseus]
MKETGKRIAMEGGEVDRISNLPITAIDSIIKSMPIRDAVRTSILSKKWRHIWANNPYIILDEQFSKEIRRRRTAAQFQNEFAHIVNRILLQHFGPIVEFVIDISDVNSVRYSDIDLWMLFLSKKGVQDLVLDNSRQFPYRLPSYIFVFPELRVLSISNCIFKPPSTFGGFSKLTELKIKETTLESCVLNVPLLVDLELNLCRGIGNVHIHAPTLKNLTHINNVDLEISFYMGCKDMESAYLSLKSDILRQREGEKINLATVLGWWPGLSELELTAFAIKNLTADIVPENFPIRHNNLQHLFLYDISFDLNQIGWILCLLRSSPLLSHVEICADYTVSNDKEVLAYLGQPDLMNKKIEQLHIVKMIYFTGAEVELAFVKLLLGCCPSLESISVYEDKEKMIDATQRTRMMKELMRFSRASEKAEMFFQANTD